MSSFVSPSTIMLLGSFGLKTWDYRQTGKGKFFSEPISGKSTKSSGVVAFLSFKYSLSPTRFSRFPKIKCFPRATRISTSFFYLLSIVLTKLNTSTPYWQTTFFDLYHFLVYLLTLSIRVTSSISSMKAIVVIMDFFKSFAPTRAAFKEFSRSG
jgi:hypothetical protein